jgi:hypothetical protein
VVPTRDVKQWKQACREVGLTKPERKQATKDFHKEKEAFGERRHLPYGNLIIWLQEWKDDR